MTADERTFAIARRVLTDTEYLTWAMAQKGISRTAIAFYRRVSKGTVNDCLARCRQKIEAAQSGDEVNPR